MKKAEDVEKQQIKGQSEEIQKQIRKQNHNTISKDLRLKQSMTIAFIDRWKNGGELSQEWPVCQSHSKNQPKTH